VTECIDCNAVTTYKRIITAQFLVIFVLTREMESYATQQSYYDTYLTKAQLIYILSPYLSEYMAQIK